MAEPSFAKYPDLSLSQHIFNMANSYAPLKCQQASLQYVMNSIKTHKMAALYWYIAHPIEGILHATVDSKLQSPTSFRKAASPASTLLGTLRPSGLTIDWDPELYDTLKADNEKELESIQKEEDEAVENGEDSEIQAAKGKRAEFWSRIGDKDNAVTEFEAVFEKCSISGMKIDILLALIRIGFFFNDKILVKKSIERANSLVEAGGDWDRRNRLKVYQGLNKMTLRLHAAGAPLLLDSLSTFTSYELCSYSHLVVYAVLSGIVTLKRVEFKNKIVDSSEVKAILGDSEDKRLAMSGAIAATSAIISGSTNMDGFTQGNLAAINTTSFIGSEETKEKSDEEDIDFKPLANLVNSLYEGEYQLNFQALAKVEEEFLCRDRYLYDQRRWYVREMRLRGYQQLLQSYRVVSLRSMARDFGVTVDYLDRDLAKFIASSRVPCTIDRVNEVIETNRPDDKNKQYHNIVKQGDQLITKLQKYGQAVRMRGSERG